MFCHFILLLPDNITSWDPTGTVISATPEWSDHAGWNEGFHQWDRKIIMDCANNEDPNH